MERPKLNQPLKSIKWIFWKRHLDDQIVSGMSIAHYCYMHGLSTSTFNLWRKRFFKEKPNISSDEFVLPDCSDKTPLISKAVSQSARFVSLALDTNHDTPQSRNNGAPSLIRLHVEGMVLEFYENIDPCHFQCVLNAIRGGQ